MKLNELLAKIGENKLRTAMENDDSSALQQLFADEGVEVTDEQLDYIAGGMSVRRAGSHFAGGSDISCLYPGQSCV